jgi:hypothetical protein
MSTQILPAPSIWLGLVYFVPSVLGFIIWCILWRRMPSIPSEKRAVYKSNLLGFIALELALTGVVITLIRWP